VIAERIAGNLSVTSAQAARIGGSLLIIAGLYQLTPWKNVCLTKCRTPMSFIVTSWRDGAGGAVRMGFVHGFYCLGCCWLLFVILFPLGMMNVAAMAVITIVIFAEKSFPWGRLVAQISSAALVVYGVATLFVPILLPTSPR
jgi:predicted metal-binding membrane protein